MYIKNINQLLKEHIPLKLRLSEGSAIYGKIISQEGKNGLIKLYDGTIIPSIFLSENKLVTDRFIKFVIDQFDESGLILKVIDDSMDFESEDSINLLISKLNIPKEEGTKIINSLIRFNLPATDENIMTIYKNITFLESLGKMKDNDILSFLHNYIEGDFTSESKEFSTAKGIFSKLLKIDTDFLSFLIENDIPYSIENMLNSSNFLENKFNFNNIINTLKNLLEINNDISSNILIKDLIKTLLDNPENLSLMNDYLEGKLFAGSGAYSTAEETFNEFSNMNLDYISSLIQSKLPDILENLPEVSHTIMDKNVTHQIINELENLLGKNAAELFSSSIKDVIKELVEKPELLPLLHNFVEEKQPVSMDGFDVFQKVFSKYSNNRADYVSSLIDEKMPEILSRIFDDSDLQKDPLITHKIINELKKALVNNKEALPMLSFDKAIKEILNKPDVLRFFPDGVLSNFNNDIEIFKYLNNNYNIYFFNSYNNDKMFKNSIIIKHKYKANSIIDPDNVRVFITVEAPTIGVVESYLYKKGKNLTLSIKTEEKYINLFKRNIEALNKILNSKGYNVINISVGSIDTKTNLVSLSNFFNDTIFKELDVRV